MRVLVVEDEVKMAGLLKRGLEEEGHAVDTAGDGQQALWLATENPYDAVVLDVMLPDFDGFEVCRKLREAGRWSPVLMLTARDAVPDRVAGLDAGADDYLTKPFPSPSSWLGCGRSFEGERPSARSSFVSVTSRWTPPPVVWPAAKSPSSSRPRSLPSLST